MLSDDFTFSRRKIDGAWYEISVGGVVVGEVYHEPSAWSWAPWMIVGERRKRRGGVNDATEKLAGYPTLKAAARQLATMQSALLVNLS